MKRAQSMQGLGEEKILLPICPPNLLPEKSNWKGQGGGHLRETPRPAIKSKECVGQPSKRTNFIINYLKKKGQKKGDPGAYLWKFSGGVHSL